MRYLTLTYYTKADGKIDEAMAVSKNIRPRDLQTASVILDFKKLQVVKCSMNGVQVPRDWDRIVTYYHQHYEATIERLFAENGYQIVKPETTAKELHEQSPDTN
jgi:hypothetical protein